MAIRMYREESRFSPTTLAQAPPFPASVLWEGRPHPISPEQALQGPSQEPSAHPKGCSGERTGVPMAARPKAHGQKSRMKHWTQVPAGRGSREEELGESPAKEPALPLPHPTPAWPPASASSPQDTQTPTQTWLGKLTRPVGSKCSNPERGNRTWEGKATKQQNTSLSPQ